MNQSEEGWKKAWQPRIQWSWLRWDAPEAQRLGIKDRPAYMRWEPTTGGASYVAVLDLLWVWVSPVEALHIVLRDCPSNMEPRLAEWRYLGGVLCRRLATTETFTDIVLSLSSPVRAHSGCRLPPTSLCAAASGALRSDAGMEPLVQRWRNYNDAQNFRVNPPQGV